MSIPYEKIVEEDISLGTGTVTVTMPAGGTAVGSQVGLHTFTTTPFPPQFRLSLTSGVPIPRADVTAATTIYYTPLVGSSQSLIVNWTGAGTKLVNVVSAELSLALDSNAADSGYHQSGKIFDLYIIRVAGVIKLASSVAWASDTSIGTGVGTAERTTSASGCIVNAQSMSMRYGSGSADVATVAAGVGVYVGSFYATANGQTEMEIGSPHVQVSGGTDNVLGLWNKYNRVPIRACEREGNATEYNYVTAAWAAFFNSSANRIRYLDGDQESPWKATFFCANTSVATPSDPDPQGGSIGIQLDAVTVYQGETSQSAYPGQLPGGTGAPGNFGETAIAFHMSKPLLGLHAIRASMHGSTGAGAWELLGWLYSGLYLDIEM